jgi:hypothetical protein
MCDFALAPAAEGAYVFAMSVLSTKALATKAVAFCAASAEHAWARSKKQAEPVAPSIMVDEGTPIIMQGLERTK